MKYIILLFIALFILSIGFNYSMAQGNDSSRTQETKMDQNNYEELEDDYSPGFLIFVIIGFGLGLMGIGAGIVLTLIGILVMVGLISLGVVSTSILVGINKKSASKGFQTFIYLGSSIGGMVLGGIGLYILNFIFHWWNPLTSLLIGAGSGLIGGIGIGITSIWIIKRATDFFKKKLELI